MRDTMTESQTKTNIYDGITEQQVGKPVETEITEVAKGRSGDLIPASVREASKYPIDENGIVVVVRTANGAVEYFNIPADGVLKPKHKLSVYKKTYGKFPEEKDKVYTKIDTNGFYTLSY